MYRIDAIRRTGIGPSSPSVCLVSHRSRHAKRPPIILASAIPPSFPTLVAVSAAPILKVILLTATGALAARLSILMPLGAQQLARITYFILTPALLFDKLAGSISMTNLFAWSSLIWGTWLSILVGLAVGLLLTRLVRTPIAYRNLVACSVALANVGNLPLVLVASLAADPLSPFHGLEASGAAYVALVMCAHSLFNFSIGSRMMRKEDTNVWGIVTSIQWRDVLTPPNVACLAALLVGLVPPLQGLFYSSSPSIRPPLALVTQVLSAFSNALIPCIMLVLGASLVAGPPRSNRLPPSTVAIAVLGRLVIVPVLGVLLLWMLGPIIHAPDPLYLTLLLLNFAMPGAISLNQLATLHDYGVDEISTILFYQYMASILTLPLIILCCLHFL